MSKISAEKEQKIKEAILSLLFQNSPKALFTAQISSELARDEEFIKKLLLVLEQQGIVRSVKRSAKGKFYIKRTRWQLTPKAYQAYKQLENG